MALGLPLPLAPLSVPRIWGGQRLVDWLEEPPADAAADQAIGEIWCCSDREDAGSVVAGGPFDGRSLRGLMLSEREALLGPDAELEDFPLLVKFIEAQRDLSVQVHPDEKAAERLGVQCKYEAWLVLDASPEAEIMLGFTEGVDGRAFAAQAGEPGTLDLMRRHRVRAGDFIAVRPGTVHSIGAGIVLAEVQQNSDTTFRVYDFGRKGFDGTPRELHIEEALASIDYDHAPDGPVRPDFVSLADGVNRRATLLSDELLHIELYEVHQPTTLQSVGRCEVLQVLEGRAELRAEGMDAAPLRRGQTWVLPADCGPLYLDGFDGDLRLLRSRAGARTAAGNPAGGEG